MAQQQSNVQVAAPGFAGLNTQDSPTGMDVSYAAIANNCVIDKFGRVGSRKGLQQFVLNPEDANGPDANPFETLHIKGNDIDDPSSFVMVGSVGDTVYLVDETGAWTHTTDATNFTHGNWAYCEALDNIIMAHDNAGMYYVNSAGTFAVMPEQPDGGSVTMTNKISNPWSITAAFGHVFVAEKGGTVVQWSANFSTQGPSSATFWSDATAGTIDVADFWPSGGDHITALAAHNNYLVVFGERNVLLYNLNEPNGSNYGPAFMWLEDSIVNIGCIARDSVVSTGTDYFFLDASGVRLLDRTIQEQTVPVGDVSRNVRDDLKADVGRANRETIRAVYSPEEAFYLLFLPNASSETASKTYCFDTRQQLDLGVHRAMLWPNKTITAGARSPDGKLFLGHKGGAYEYTGAEDTYDLTGVDTPQAVLWEYWTHPQNLGSATTLKFPKEVDLTLVGGANFTLTVKWSFDYSDTVTSNTVERSSAAGAMWGAFEGDADGAVWGTDTWGESGGSISQHKVKMWNSGRNVKLGFLAEVTDTPLSIQEFNLQVLTGRIL